MKVEDYYDCPKCKGKHDVKPTIGGGYKCLNCLAHLDEDELTPISKQEIEADLAENSDLLNDGLV